jgi:hypothetical protein
MNSHAFYNLDNDELQVVFRLFPPDYPAHTQNLHHFDGSMTWFQNILAYSAWHLKCGRIHVSSSEDRVRLAQKQLAYGFTDHLPIFARSYFKALLDEWTQELRTGLAYVLGAYTSIRLQENCFSTPEKAKQLDLLIETAIGNGLERDTGIASVTLSNICNCIDRLQKANESSSIDESSGIHYLELCGGLAEGTVLAVQAAYGVCERVEGFWARERRKI